MLLARGRSIRGAACLGLHDEGAWVCRGGASVRRRIGAGMRRLSLKLWEEEIRGKRGRARSGKRCDASRPGRPRPGEKWRHIRRVDPIVNLKRGARISPRWNVVVVKEIDEVSFVAERGTCGRSRKDAFEGCAFSSKSLRPEA